MSHEFEHFSSSNPPPMGQARDMNFYAKMPGEREWFWPGHMPLGGITLIAGDSSTGKSLFALNLAARVSSGQPFPDGSPSHPARVLLVKPYTPHVQLSRCLIEAGANLNLIHSRSERDSEVTTRFSFSNEDFEQLTRDLHTIRPGLLIIDPLVSLKRPGTRFTDDDLMIWLERLQDLSLSTQCSVLLIVKRLARGSYAARPHALERSSTLWDLAQSIFLTLRDPEDAQRFYLANAKQTLGPLMPPLGYTCANTNSDLAHTTLHWDAEPTSMTIADILHPRSKKDTHYSVQRAQIFQILSDAAMPLTMNEIMTALHIPTPTQFDDSDYRKAYSTVAQVLTRMKKDQQVTQPAKGLFAAVNPTPTFTLPALTNENFDNLDNLGLTPAQRDQFLLAYMNEVRKLPFFNPPYNRPLAHPASLHNASEPHHNDALSLHQDKRDSSASLNQDEACSNYHDDDSFLAPNRDDSCAHRYQRDPFVSSNQDDARASQHARDDSANNAYNLLAAAFPDDTRFSNFSHSRRSMDVDPTDPDPQDSSSSEN